MTVNELQRILETADANAEIEISVFDKETNKFITNKFKYMLEDINNRTVELIGAKNDS